MCLHVTISLPIVVTTLLISNPPHTRALLTLTFFFFTIPATTEIYTLSLHDALPIYIAGAGGMLERTVRDSRSDREMSARDLDRKSTRLNSSHRTISYAVFCLKKKKTTWLPFLRRPYTFRAIASS